MEFSPKALLVSVGFVFVLMLALQPGRGAAAAGAGFVIGALVLFGPVLVGRWRK